MIPYPDFLQFAVISFLVAAAVNDIRKREVPNWVNYGLAVVGIGFAGLQSIIKSDWHLVVFSLVGCAVAYGLAALMFYTGQWGGGDSKLLIGMGAVLGLPFSLSAPFISVGNGLVSFVFNFVSVSLAYALVMGTILAFRNRKAFSLELRKQAQSHALIRKALLVVAVLGLIAILVSHNYMVRLGTFALVVSLFAGVYLSILAKAVEKSGMVKKVSPLKLTEGDWIAKDVVVSGKRICGPKDLGIEKSQIRKLVALYRKGKIKAVQVKEGIPFAPTFLVAYLLTILFGNLFFAFL